MKESKEINIKYDFLHNLGTHKDQENVLSIKGIVRFEINF